MTQRQFILNDFQKEIWENNYKAHTDKSIEDTWLRVARAGASIEEDKPEWTARYFSIMDDFTFVPGGRILANAGTKHKGVTMMNCFAHNPLDIGFKNPDSLIGIFEMIKAQALTLKSEGGYGTNFSYIRPAGTIIKGIGVVHPGVVKYMELWDKSSAIITEGSDEVRGKIPHGTVLKKKIRKGAMMGILSVWHPDIEEFIDAKLQPNRLTKFNVSVGITQGFMEAVRNNEKWDLKFPDTYHKNYDKEWMGDIEAWEAKDLPVVIYKTVKARDLWDRLTYATYTRNEPGILFLDLADKLNPLGYHERILQSNPCGEILMSTGVCNLGSLNLVKFVKHENGTTNFDFRRFREVIHTAVRFLDNINDITPVPLPEYKKSMQEKRRIGLGVMGFGSLHFMMGIRYGSEDSKRLTEEIFRTKAEEEILASAHLGKEKGDFPAFDKKKFFSSFWWKNLQISEKVKQEVEKTGHMRNSHRSANAPTGTISIFCGTVSGGIEPVFMREYTRWTIVVPKEKLALRKAGFKFPDISRGEWEETKNLKLAKRGDDEVLRGTFEETDYEVDRNRGLIKAVTMEDYGWKYVKETHSMAQDLSAYDTTEKLSVDEHLDILKIVSHYTDMNSSKTVNLPNDYSFKDFKDIYMKGYESGIKGMTTYREGTMAAVLEKKKEVAGEQTEFEKTFASYGDKVIKKLNVKLPREYYAKGYTLKDAQTGTKWYINIAFVDQTLLHPHAIFVTTNYKESTEVTNETLSDLEDLVERKGIDTDLIKGQKDKYEGQTNVTKIARALGFCLRHNIQILDIVDVLNKGDYPISSFVFHIKKLLLKFVKEGTHVRGMKCESCGGELVYQEGCYVCTACGYSKCG
jgi:ribonucleoside-diphosphate reductase alpha chain